MAPPPIHGRLFWLGAGGGGAVMVYGFAGLFRDAARTHPDSFLPWFLGSALVHDLVLAPVVVGVGAALTRWVPSRRRPLVTSWLIVAGALSLYSMPLLLGYGRRPTNPSALPNDYGWGLGVTLAVVTAVAAMGGLLRARLRR